MVPGPFFVSEYGSRGMRTQTPREQLEWIDAQIFALLQNRESQGVLEPEDRRELEYLCKERRRLDDAVMREVQ